MPTINQLPTLDTLEPSNQVPTYSVENGDARKFSLSTLTEYLEQTMDLPDNADEITYTPAGTGAVSRTVQAKLRDVVSVKDFGAVGDGVADDTAAVQAAINTGKSGVYFPDGTYRIASVVTLSGNLTLFGSAGAVIFPNRGTPGGNVFQATSGSIVIEGLTFDGGASQPTNAAANTYIVRAGNPASYMSSVRIENCKFFRCNAVGSTTVTSNLLVTHCIYLEGVTTATIQNNTFDTISGAGVFLKDIFGLKQAGNVMKDVQWYNTNLDYNVSGSISGDYYNCTLATGVYWGGAINTVNNQGDVQNHNLVIERCTFAGKYSYGAVIRLQSDKGITVQDCTFLACSLGSLASGGTLTGVGVTTRNPDGVTPSNPPSDIKILRNRALYGFGTGTSFLAFIYINNDFGAGGRSPIYGINIADNTILSPSASSYFTHLAVIHGRSAGCEEVNITNNYAQVYIKTNQPTGGAIGLVGTDTNGKINYVQIGQNYIENLETAASSTQVGVQIGSNVDLVRSIEPNTVKGCFYGIRTISGSGSTLELLDDQYFSGNTTDTLFSQALTRYGKPLYATAAGSSSIAVGTSTVQDITVTGAAIGDNVMVGFSADSTSLFVSSAKVRVANSVRILYTNTSAGVIDASSITVYVTVTKRSTT